MPRLDGRAATAGPATQRRRFATAAWHRLERERPVLGGRDGPGAAPGHHLGGAAVFDVAAALHLDLDRHRRWLGRRVEARHPDLLDPRAADDQAGAAAGIPRVQELLDRSGIGDRVQASIGAVHGLGPRGDRAASRDLEHVGGEASVGEAQVERRSAGVALELEIRELRDLGAVGHRVVDGPLDECLIPESLLVGPRCRDDLLVERMAALGALLDRGENPASRGAADERPELAGADRLGRSPGALDVAAVTIDDVVAHLRLDPDRPRGRSSGFRGGRGPRLNPWCARAACTRLRQPLLSKSSRRRSHSASRSGATRRWSAARSRSSQACSICVTSSAAAGLTTSGANAGSSSAASAAASSTRRSVGRPAPRRRPLSCWAP